MADGDQTFYNVRSATSPTHSIENELHACSGAIGGVAIRQRTADPDAQQLLAEIAYYLRVLASRSSMPNRQTEAMRIEPTTTAVLPTVSTVVTVSSLTNINSVGGVAAGPGQLGLSGLAAAAIRSKITVTP